MLRLQHAQSVSVVALVLASVLGVALAQEEHAAVNESTAYAPIEYGPGDTWDVRDKSLLTLDLHDLLGVWKAEGAQTSRAEWEAGEGLPNCTAYADEFDYRHNINDDQYLVYALGSTENHFQIGIGHRESSTSNITSYADNILRLSYEGEEYCQTWYPYLDRNTGQLKARTVYNGVYSESSTGEIEYTSLNCNATAVPETPGCFEEPGTNGSTDVRAASVFTWVCEQGECGVYAPVFSQYDLANPHDE